MAIRNRKLSDLSPQLQRTFERARIAVTQKNYKYAFEMLQTILKAEPGCFEARMTLRQGQMECSLSKPKFLRRLLGAPKALCIITFKGRSLLKKGKVAEALDAAEKAMKADPTFGASIRFLVDVAEQAQLVNVAISALELGIRYNEKDITLMRRLAKFYNKIGEEQKGLEILQKIAEMRPHDMAIENEVKQTTALIAMSQGKWDTASSYRDVIRDKDKADELEQAERSKARDEDTLATLIGAAERDLKEQETISGRKKLGELFFQKHDYETSLEHYERALELMDGGDPGIEDAISDVVCARFDDAVAQWQSYAQRHPEKRTEAEEKVGQIEAQKAEHIYERARLKVERYPNDAQYRYELGVQEWERENVDPALKQFQSAQRNPRYLKPSMVYIGKCLRAKGMTEMAIEQFEKALAAAGDTMDTFRKDVLYCLAETHEQDGNAEKAVAYFKEIFSGDAEYRDVAQRLETFYKKG